MVLEEREQVDDNLESYSRDEFRYKNRLQRYLIVSLIAVETRWAIYLVDETNTFKASSASES